jgi:hypothetical protein
MALTSCRRYEQLKSRHRLEMEGYRNEAKGLKLRLQHVYRIVRHKQRQYQREQQQQQSPHLYNEPPPWELTGLSDEDEQDSRHHFRHNS